MTGNEAIDYIHSMTWNRKATGYEHAKALLAKMGNPEKRLKYVHIGGTNGKGSTAAMTASILKKAGYKVGLYTSPYLYRFHERIQINGEQISDEDLASVTEYVKGFADKMSDCPSEFALVCCIAFEYFARKQCDIVVLEVGMGGDADSTNVIACPEVAVLTNIGLDHTEYLGNTLEEIAGTKAGILKENGRAVLYQSVPTVNQLLENICKERNITFCFANFDTLVSLSHSLEGQTFDCGKRKNLFLPLLGEHQLKNAAVVLSVVDALVESGWRITDENVRDGLEEVTWPGRFEVIGKAPLMVIDGGHNAQCIESLAENVRMYLQDYKVVALTGVLSDKDCHTMYQTILPYIEEFICITPPSPRAMRAEELAGYLQGEGAKACAYGNMGDAIRAAMKLAGENGAILCFGSLYSIGEIREELKNI